jgi:hypothetical protein
LLVDPWSFITFELARSRLLAGEGVPSTIDRISKRDISKKVGGGVGGLAWGYSGPYSVRFEQFLCQRCRGEMFLEDELKLSNTADFCSFVAEYASL